MVFDLIDVLDICFPFGLCTIYLTHLYAVLCRHGVEDTFGTAFTGKKVFETGRFSRICMGIYVVCGLHCFGGGVDRGPAPLARRRLPGAWGDEIILDDPLSG